MGTIVYRGEQRPEPPLLNFDGTFYRFDGACPLTIKPETYEYAVSTYMEYLRMTREDAENHALKVEQWVTSSSWRL